MKTVKTVFALLVMALVVVSCGKSEPDKTVVEQVKEHFADRTDLLRIDITAGDKLNSDLSWASVYSKEGDEAYKEEVTSKEVKPKEKDKFSSNKLKEKPVEFSKFGIDSIYADYDKCVAILKEEFTGEDELEDYTLYNWDSESDENGKINVRITVNATIKSEGTHMEGRNIVTNYYEFKFKKLEDGSMELVE